MRAIRSLFVVAGFMTLQSCTTSVTELTATRREWTVMATTLEVSVYRHQSETAQTSADLDAAYAEMSDIDRIMSLYRADSELSALNAYAGKGWFLLSAKMFEILQASQHYAQLSSGAFDPTAQPLVKLWGFYRVAHAAIPSSQQIENALRDVGMNKLTLDAQRKSARLEAGAQIDLGAIAKGYAVDRALHVLRSRGVPAALVNLGGNIGVLGRPPGNRPWTVGIQHPREPRMIGKIKFWRGAVATSGDYDRYIDLDGKRYSHLLDPRTGWPTEGVFALTVIAPNATAADALSTAAFVLGPKKGIALLSRCDDTAGLVVTPATESAPPDTIIVTTSQKYQRRAASRVSIEIDQDTSIQEHSAQVAETVTPRISCIWPISSER